MEAALRAMSAVMGGDRHCTALGPRYLAGARKCLGEVKLVVVLRVAHRQARRGAGTKPLPATVTRVLPASITVSGVAFESVGGWERERWGLTSPQLSPPLLLRDTAYLPGASRAGWACCNPRAGKERVALLGDT